MASSEGRLFLLDTNALLALAWPNHQFHGVVVRRLARSLVSGWATCLLTELGFIRLSLNPAIVDVRKPPAEVLDVLSRLTDDEHHAYVDVLPPIAKVEVSIGVCLAISKLPMHIWSLSPRRIMQRSSRSIATLLLTPPRAIASKHWCLKVPVRLFVFFIHRGTLGRGSIMKTHKVTVVVLKDGKINLDDLPVHEGDEVEVVINILDRIPVTYPLHGAPFRYDDPFGPAVDPSEWDALK
jgi:hypothetical protein